ncbi:hypothetical protein Pfo_028089 [Paulownia fortunei]|nr:hypothetical protein Pfo_028089 [Paulownia fortunei]
MLLLNGNRISAPIPPQHVPTKNRMTRTRIGKTPTPSNWSPIRRTRPNPPKNRTQITEKPPHTTTPPPPDPRTPLNSPRHAAVKTQTPIHFRIYRRHLPIPSANKPPHRKTTTGQPPYRQPHRLGSTRNPIRFITRQLVPANGARVVEIKPRKNAIGVIYVLAGHFASFGSEGKGVCAHGAVRIGVYMAGQDLYCR